MTVFDYSNSRLIKDYNSIQQQFSIDSFSKREELIEKLKNKKVKRIVKTGEVQDCTFLGANNESFFYTEPGKKIQKASLNKLVLS
tara:strand:+ start:173 stop:427 length:255 start_codon:yes stop_codon:yes gene_type:complete